MQPTLLSKLPQRWPLTIWIAALLALACAVITAQVPGVEGVRMAIRFTARTSLLLFSLTFAASALVRVWPSEATRWVRRNRRYLGVGFAASHALHLCAIITFARMDAPLFDATSNPKTRIVAEIGYVFIALMALTSNDWSVEKLGRRAWNALHAVGAHYVWLVFFLSELKRVPNNPAYALAVVWLVAVMGLRIYAKRAASVPAAASAA